ncbi:MAG: Septum site-determining protein DivIVA [Firmicutes bacterium ADurb.Bin300]|nr:MAG: Septum site-determining protein DivIVA [Firmicutes bacterium ADurb.Bin300]
MLTPMQIRDKRFHSAGRNSYKSDDVDSFFDSVSESYEQMFKENTELVKRVSLLAERLDQYIKDEDIIKSAVITAQRAANKIEQEAKEKVQLLVKESEDILAAAKAEVEIIKKDTADGIRTQMEELLSNAEKEALDIIEKAKRESEDIILEAKQEAKSLQGAANRTVTSESILFGMLKKEVSDFKNELLDKYKSHIELISQLPEIALQKAKEQQEDELIGQEQPQDKNEELPAQPQDTAEKEEIVPGLDGTQVNIEFVNDDDPLEGVLTIDEFIAQGEQEKDNEKRTESAQTEEAVENNDIPFDESANELEFIGESESNEENASLDVSDFISSFEEPEKTNQEQEKQEEQDRGPKKRGFQLNLTKLSKPRENAVASTGGNSQDDRQETQHEAFALVHEAEENKEDFIFDSRSVTGFKAEKTAVSTDVDIKPDNDDESNAASPSGANEEKEFFAITDKNEKLKKRFSVIRLNDSKPDTSEETDEGTQDEEDTPPPSRTFFKKKK